MTLRAGPGDRRERRSKGVFGPLAGAALTFDSAPTLGSDRLVLRHFRASDIDYFAAVMADEEVTRHVGGPNCREDAWRKMLTGAGCWSVIGLGMWAVERRKDSRTIGHVGFFDFQRDMEPSIAGEPEMGWIFDPQGHGLGYATEACRAALGWFDRHFGAVSVPAIIALGNAPSMRLAERLGFDRQPDAIYRGEPIALFRRPPSR